MSGKAISWTVSRVVAALVTFAPTKRGRRVAKSLARELVFEAERRIDSTYLRDLIPEVASIEAHCTLDTQHDWELPYAERVVLDAIARAKAPRVVVEFGTFTGRTTLLLALAAPGAVVHTIDLPFRGPGHDPVGSAYRDTPAAGRIRQLRIDSKQFDFRGLAQTADLVFVDAGHEYEDVEADSGNALKLVAPGGIIVWDDYHPRHPGVYRALNDLSRSQELRQIARTRLVIHRRSEFS